MQLRIREARAKGVPLDLRDRIDRIVLAVAVAGPDGTQSFSRYPADVLFLDSCSSRQSDAQPLIAADSDIGAEELARLLRRAYFRPCDDIESDSYDTQSDRFDDEAMHMALNLVASPDEATRAAISRAVLQDIHWLMPKGRHVDIAVRGEHVLVKLGPPPGA